MRCFITALFVFLLGIFTSHAQENLFLEFRETPLKDVIQQLEKEVNLNFSYAEDLVENKSITVLAEGLSFDEVLGLLEAQTGLHFEKIDGQPQVIIVPVPLKKNSCIYLLDQDTRLPISENEVIVDSTIVIETDKRGLIQFENPKKTEYHIEAAGYKSITIKPKETCTSIYLTPAYKVLKEVIVTSYITTGIDRNRDGSITVAQKPLGSIPGQTTPDILQSIQLIPGVSSLDESASGIQIHGGTSDQNLVLFDHIRVFNSGYLYGMLSRFNPYATEKATIFKTATSAAYGDRVSGIIDLSTDSDVAKELSGGLGIDGLSIDGYIRAPISKKSSLSVYARNAYLDIYKTPTYEAYAKKIFNNSGRITDSSGNALNVSSDDGYTYDTSENEFRFYDVNAKYVYRPSVEDKISISALMTRNRTLFSFASEGETKNDSLATGNGGISINWLHSTSSTQTDQITTYFSSYDSYYQNEEYVGQTLEETNIRGNRISDFGLELKSDRTFKSNDLLSYGYQLSNTNLEIDLSSISNIDPNNTMSLPVRDSNLKNVLFGEYSFRRNNGGIFRFGLRAVHYGSLGNLYLEPRLNFEISVNKSLRIRTGLERRNQPISQLIEFNQTELRLDNNLWRLSDNVNYPLLKGNQFSTGLLFNKNGWTLDAEAYYKSLKGLTSYSQGFNLPQPYLSEGKSSIIGMDILLKKRIQNYRFWVGYSYNNVNFTFNQILENSFAGNNDIPHSFRISNSLDVKNFQFSIGWQYRSGTPFTPIKNYDEETKEVVFETLNNGRLPNFHRLDASINYKFPVDKNSSFMQIGFSALNIYNRIVPLAIVHRTIQQNNQLLLEQVIQRSSLGFTPNLTLRVFF
ncbi:TonB-dependent receptor plug domain-containing protein [[Muricauda] lutisoli]|uniref:TonB-dependent receptor plug domain-containing protein n=1 Tax=[Muricauda] lutisoli TaxID=2816035 RepID=A0ABS3EY96_9FLAO|nr:TonB-dependent receptor plug domain-containing protein [[Muricauda] lutisoli]MBO0331234.1 TonB-dependent receptor plug domain-containing protein [[Muricauda] lutisoli]